MKTVKQVLTENRGFTIQQLRKEFIAKSYDLAELMAAYLAFVSGENWQEVFNSANPQAYIKHSVKLFFAEYAHTLGTNQGFMSAQTEQEKQNARKSMGV